MGRVWFGVGGGEVVTSPVVAVTRDLSGLNTRLSWCETEQRYYLDGVAVQMTFDEAHSVWSGVSLRPSTREVGVSAARALTLLARNPWADVSDLFTHELAEPGAPLEPIPGRAA